MRTDGGKVSQLPSLFWPVTERFILMNIFESLCLFCPVSSHHRHLPSCSTLYFYQLVPSCWVTLHVSQKLELFLKGPQNAAEVWTFFETIIKLFTNTSKYDVSKYEFMWVWPLHIHTITIWIKHIQALDKILAWAITQEDKELWSLIFSFDYRTRDLASYPSHTDSLWV